jgi:MFS transporter, putative metabolite:H+ symporter
MDKTAPPIAASLHPGDPRAIEARLDRLPMSREIWRLVALLSLGGFFESYDIGLTATLPPGLLHAGVFQETGQTLFGLPHQAAFAVATFAGLFLGTAGLGQIADRIGRRAIFTVSLLWYAVSTLIMVCQSSPAEIVLWRFIGGIGIGLELVTIDSYIVELVPAGSRGKAFAINQSIQFAAAPLAALLSWLVMPAMPLSIEGWRWVAAFPALGAVLVWWIRLSVPESPRWLAAGGDFENADRIVTAIEARTAIASPEALPSWTARPRQDAVAERLGVIFRGAYRKRTVMLVLLNVFQAVGFYGFNTWLPTLLAAQGIGFVNSLYYTFIIAIVYPIAPLFFMGVADKVERKWLIVAASVATAVFGLAFSQQSRPLALVVFGVLITTSTILLSFSYHAYQTELYPTRIRARAVGFVYSFGRLGIIFANLAVSALLKSNGPVGVFIFIAASMAIVAAAVATMGPKTRNVPLDESATDDHSRTGP